MLILDLLSLTDPGAIDAKVFRSVLNAGIAGQVLGSDESAIYVLGDPRFDLPCEPYEGRAVEPFLSWTGLEFRWDGRGGVAVERGPEGHVGPLGVFASGLDRYDYSMAECRVAKDEKLHLWGFWDMDAFDGSAKAVCEVADVYTTRYGLSIAFVVSHAVVSAQVPVQMQVGRKTYLRGRRLSPPSERSHRVLTEGPTLRSRNHRVDLEGQYTASRSRPPNRRG